MFKPRRVQKKALPARVRTTGREGPRGRRGYYPAREGRRQENSDSARPPAALRRRGSGPRAVHVMWALQGGFWPRGASTRASGAQGPRYRLCPSLGSNSKSTLAWGSHEPFAKRVCCKSAPVRLLMALRSSPAVLVAAAATARAPWPVVWVEWPRLRSDVKAGHYAH